MAQTQVPNQTPTPAPAKPTMGASINLLPQVAEAEIQTGVYRKKANVFSVAALLIVFVIVAALFAYQLFLLARNNSLDQNIKQKEGEINQKLDVEIKQRAFVGKLQAISDQMNKNHSTADMIQTVMDLATASQIILTQVNADYAGNLLVSGKTPSSSNLAKFIISSIDQNAQPNLASVVASSLTLKDGTYQFTIQMNYTKVGLLQASKP